jgi:hypothetical protein
LGQALAQCYWRAWYQAGTIADSHVFYVDMHDKVIRSCRFLGEVWYPDGKSLPESYT